MKKIINSLSTLILFGLLFSCSDSHEPSIKNVYKLNGVKNYAPIEIFEVSSYVVFENSNGSLKEFSLEFERREVEKSSGNSKYVTEELDVNLINSDEEYYINTYVSSNKLNNNINEFIISSLYTSANNGLIPSVKVDSNGDALICQILSEITLNNKSFINVYTNFTNPISSNDSFRSIYYTSDQGIVGFYDDDGELWNLKEYK